MLIQNVSSTLSWHNHLKDVANAFNLGCRVTESSVIHGINISMGADKNNVHVNSERKAQVYPGLSFEGCRKCF